MNADINATVRLLLKHELISGFIYVYSYGLLDFAGAFQLTFEHMMLKQPDQNLSRGVTEFPSPEQTDIGYKLLLFLQYTSENRVFPRGEKYKLPRLALLSLIGVIISPAILAPIAESPRLDSHLESQPLFMKTFPYLFALAKIDFYALFYCLHLCLVELYAQGPELMADANMLYGDMLYSVLLFAKFGDEDQKMKNTFQRCFYEHSLDHVVSINTPLPEPFVQDIISHCKSHLKPLSLAENYMFTLVNSQSKCSFNPSNFAIALERNGFFFPALRLYGGKIKPTPETLTQALQNYLLDRNEDTRHKIFDYIGEFFTKLEVNTDNGLDNTTISKCRLILINYLEEMALINLIHTKRVVGSYLSNCVSEVIEKTQKQQRLQFELLDALIRGTFDTPDSTNQEGLIENFSVDDLLNPQQMLVYISQLSTFRPMELHGFLATHHNYPLDEVLKVCKSKNLFDATAYLLERAGDFQAALDLCISEINSALLRTIVGVESLLKDQHYEMDSKKQGIRRGSKSLMVDVLQILKIGGNHQPSSGHVYGLSSPVLEPVFKLEGFQSFSKAITIATGICTRFESKSTSVHWFKVLDYLLKEKRKNF
jgi:hypothetical protein